jgi:drug/metabolite transporter (DMT)-like permease
VKPVATPPASPTEPLAPVWLVLVVALLAVSVAGTLVRFAPGTHPLTLAFGRVLIAGVVLLPFGLRGFMMPSRRDLGLTLLAGGFLALHFWAWFTSLQLTSVMRSTVLVCTTPVWVGLLEALVLGRPPPPRYWPGIIVALIGIFGLSSRQLVGTASLTGDAYAVLGSWLGASYFVIGSAVRTRVGIAVYGPAVCLAAAAVLLGLATATGAPLLPVGEGSLGVMGVIVGMALGPQLIGHIGFNWAVKYVPARVIAAVILLEPVGGSLVAALFLHELPTLGDGGWALLLLAGVGIACS